MGPRKSFTPIVELVSCPTGSIKYELQKYKCDSVYQKAETWGNRNPEAIYCIYFSPIIAEH